MELKFATPDLFAALAKAQAEMSNALKVSTNAHFRNNYADLAEVLSTIRPVYAKHGVALVQSTSFDGTMVYVTTALTHSGGGYISSVACCVPAKIDAQGIGACTTYLRRYAASAMTALGQEDDDGNAASHSTPPPPARPTKNQTRLDSESAFDDERARLHAASSLSELSVVWKGISAEARRALVTAKDEAKSRIENMQETNHAD